MLGHVVARYLRESGHEILKTDARFQRERDDNFAAAIKEGEPEWCVNCTGFLPRCGVDEQEMDLVNAKLPRELIRSLPTGCGVIQASSDGVFADDAGECSVDRRPNADDPYGRSKIAGEVALVRPNDYVIRCSIVGPETVGRSQGLLTWFFSSNESVNGFENHLWNGITTLEWARWCGRIISGETNVGRVLQPASSPPVSKHALLGMISEIWSHDRRLSAHQSPISVNRVMISNVKVPSLLEQLRELKRWY